MLKTNELPGSNEERSNVASLGLLWATSQAVWSWGRFWNMLNSPDSLVANESTWSAVCPSYVILPMPLTGGHRPGHTRQNGTLDVHLYTSLKYLFSVHYYQLWTKPNGGIQKTNTSLSLLLTLLSSVPLVFTCIHCFSKCLLGALAILWQVGRLKNWNVDFS